MISNRTVQTCRRADVADDALSIGRLADQFQGTQIDHFHENKSDEARTDCRCQKLDGWTLNGA